MLTKKNNIMYILYIETKIILNDLVIEHARLLEKNLRDRTVENIGNLISIANEKLLLLNQEESTDEAVQEANKILKQELETELVNLNDQLVEAEVVYKANLQLISKMFAFEVFSKYSDELRKYDLYGDYFKTLKEKELVFNLLSSEISKNWVFKNFFSIPSFNSFNIFYIMYMEDFLFFWNLKSTNLRTLRLWHKLRLRKWRFKRKKLRRLYVLKKLKKTLFFRKFKKKSTSFYLSTINFTKVRFKLRDNILVQKIPLAKKVIRNTNLDFFYKLNRKINEELFFLSNSSLISLQETVKDFTIYLRNFHQKPYWKLRKARILHWSLFYTHTLRKKRYRGFINRFVKKHSTLSYNYTFFVNFFTKFLFSWTRTNKLESFCKNSLVHKISRIVKLPIFFSNVFSWKILKIRNYKLKKKVGRWSFLNFKRSQLPWLQYKKNSPKAINHIQPNNQFIKALSNWDPITSSLHLKKNVPSYSLPPVDRFKVNWHIKLNMYRYNPNKKCLLHKLFIQDKKD